MKEAGKWQRSQWIPWEISYSLRETTRNDRTSHNNAILAVILPNKNGNYDYYDKSNLFPILKDNIDNGYIYVVTWDDFVKYPNADIKQAFDYREKTPTYKIKKSLQTFYWQQNGNTKSDSLWFLDNEKNRNNPRNIS